MALPKVDVVILGLGAAGGVMAKELATAGMKVVGIDQGRFRRTKDFVYHDELRFSIRGELLQPAASATPMQWRLNANVPANPWIAWELSVGVGGGTQHYSAQHWRMLPHHFKQRSENIARYGIGNLPVGSNVVDWPISYNDLAPYYDMVDTQVGVSGKAGNINGQIQTGGNPFEGPRSKDFPLPPLLQTTGARLFTSVCSALGYKPFPAPAGIISQDYNGRPACNYCGFCTSYGCHVGAKSSTLVTMIPLAVASGNMEIRADCRVLKINSDGQRATSVTYIDPAGVVQEQPASLVILSSYCWGNVRTLLLSGINKYGMVGKYFMPHDYQFVTGFFDSQVTNVSEGPTGANSTIDEFNGDNFDHTGLGFIEGASITSLGGNTQAIGGSGFGLALGVPTWGSSYKDFVKRYFDKNLTLIAQLPPLPYDANYLDLDPNVKDAYGQPVLRITYQPYDNENKAAAFLQTKMAGILKQLGATSMYKGPPFFPPASAHETGGTRMGDDPNTSVVNRYCQSHELGNLFVVGGSVFPTFFGYNPTHTIEALSFWAANYVKSQVSAGGTLAQYM